MALARWLASQSLQWQQIFFARDRQAVGRSVGSRQWQRPSLDPRSFTLPARCFFVYYRETATRPSFFDPCSSHAASGPMELKEGRASRRQRRTRWRRRRPFSGTSSDATTASERASRASERPLLLPIESCMDHACTAREQSGEYRIYVCIQVLC